MKTIYGVILKAECTAPLSDLGARPYPLTEGGMAWSLRCTAVSKTDWGFIQLVPASEGTKLPSVYLSVSDVLFILKAEEETQMGFIATALDKR